LSLPEGKTKTDEYFGEQQVYHHSLTATVPVSRNGAHALELPLSVGVPGLRGRRPLLSAGDTQPRWSSCRRALGTSRRRCSAPDSPPNARRRLHLRAGPPRGDAALRQRCWLVLATCSSALGLLLAFTPCVLPMVPILSGIIAGDGGQGACSTRRAFALSLTYVLGMAVTYTLAGVAAAAAGSQMQAMFQQPWIIVLFALLFVVLALSMFGPLHDPDAVGAADPAQRRQQPAARWHVWRRRGHGRAVVADRHGLRRAAAVRGARGDRPDRRRVPRRQRAVRDVARHGRAADPDRHLGGPADAARGCVDGHGQEVLRRADAGRRGLDAGAASCRSASACCCGRCRHCGRRLAAVDRNAQPLGRSAWAARVAGRRCSAPMGVALVAGAGLGSTDPLRPDAA
jgi:hypothetical protein